MNFFQQQAEARNTSRRLVLLFALAVMAVITAVTLVVYAVFGNQDAAYGWLAAANLGANSGLLTITALLVALIITGASLFRIASLSGGGGQVARELGAERVHSETRDPSLQRLRNVVEEIAIASGVPVPEIYVLEREEGINAFAAGHQPADAAVTVTRGALEKLSRDELQGVIAHEFSHILNADMRLNIRLIGLLFGITAIALLGRKILTHLRFSGGGRKSGGGIVLVAVGLLAIGSVGLLAARLIQAAISRRRESLADASAVQFTRHPPGLAGALKKIAALGAGARLDAESTEIAHMLFADSRPSRLFDTHPPLLERIRAIEPGFQPAELKRVAADLKRRAEVAAAPERVAKAAPPGIAITDPAAIMANIGQPDWQQLLYAAVLAQAIPSRLAQAARSTEWSPALTTWLQLSADPDFREKQLLEIARLAGSAFEERVRTLNQTAGTARPAQRLPLLELALPALKRRPRSDLIELLRLWEALARRQATDDTFPYLQKCWLSAHLAATVQGATAPTGRRRLDELQAEAAILLALIAGYEHNLHPPEHAYRRGWMQLDLGEPPPYRDVPLDPEPIDRALQALDRLRPDGKQRLVEGLLATAFHDREANLNEVELLRAITASLGVPLPPLDLRVI